MFHWAEAWGRFVQHLNCIFHLPFLKSSGSKGSNCQKGLALCPEVFSVENHLERGVVPQRLWAVMLMGRMMGRVAALEKPGEALPGEMAAARLLDSGVGHNPSTWMKQRHITCPKVLAFALHSSITSIFLNI